ncbi:FtsK/SpoIIIE domain-containing protein [Streptosporangium carneum]|uniref:Cell division protein FtsK n=1 Tax=Streptosporangium carneum TaxID=47481 RepID=A0A9W6HWD1_9ACTN|nr:FtsK/SpoIIIE domain-containing protein [Streptosporangium carneum]GLK07531.1 cell division protein FtsK [Streptosporangium carneum]
MAGGAGAAARATLCPGTPVTVGRAAGSGLALADPEVSRTHAGLLPSRDGTVELADAGSRNGTAWHGARLTGPVAVSPGDVFTVGETVLTVRAIDPADAAVEPAPGGETLLCNRPPRIPARPSIPSLALPRRPEEPRNPRFPLVAILLPLLLAGVAYAVFPGAGYFLIFLALSPILVLANVVSDRRGGRREFRTAVEEYERRRAEIAERLAELADEQGRSAREALPDPGRLLRIATGPTRRLFERRPHDDDFLRLRLGLAARPVEVAFTDHVPGEEIAAPAVGHAPVAVDLPAVGVLGVAGPRQAVLAAARAALAHLAVLHGPHDVGLVVLTGGDEAAEWEWATWLPHTLPHTAESACRRTIATDARQAAVRLAELRRIVEDRRAEQRATLRAGTPSGRRMVVVADGARRLRGLPGLAELLAEGPEAGVYALCLDDDETNLPDECRATAVVTSSSGTRARVSRPGGDPVEGVLLDRLTLEDARVLGHALAPMRVLGGRWGAEAELPEAVRLLDLAGLGRDPAPETVAGRWARNPGGRGTTVPLGMGASGPVTVDLRRDGPHALVAGTSGAGKSELLQTLVAGLALENAPDALSMVLVDYKGGSAFAECRELPHCVGMVTDLDGHLVSRALASLGAELRRREELLAEAGAKDIEDYWAVTGGRLPRLVIVVDEFASLVEEVPEFVTGVVGIGMRGRSLGVHVVLATQRPAGVVSGELRANLNLRICLRVTGASDSGDVIDVPDAARLSRHRPGRAYLRAGHSDLALMQTARIGWPRGEAAADAERVTIRPRLVHELGNGPSAPSDDPDGSDPSRGSGPQEVPGVSGASGDRGIRGVSGVMGVSGTGTGSGARGEHDGETDLGVLVTAIRAAAELTGTTSSRSPWLPPLPEALTVEDLAARETGAPLRVPIGLADLPGQQARRPYLLDLEQAGTVLVAGMTRSGRSTLLRVIGVELARRNSPADVHLYVLDMGNRALAPLAALPHCGAYVDGEDADRAVRVLTLLTEEIGRRQRLLSEGGGEALPHLVLMLDRYETFLARHLEVDGGKLVDVLDGLLRRGPSVGVVTVVAADRSGFTQRLGGAIATRLVLRHADPDELAVYGVAPRQAPRAMPPGRMIAMPGTVEVQVALLDADPDGVAQATAAERFARESRERWKAVPAEALPRRADPLPVTITSAEAEAMRVGGRPLAPTVCTVGVGGDRLGPVDVDLAELGHGFLVAGPPGSGRSGALLAVVRSVAMPSVLVCPRPSPLRELAGRPGVAAVVSGDEVANLYGVLTALDPPFCVVVDDAELLTDGPAAPALEEMARAARDSGSLLVAACTTDDLQAHRFRGWLSMLRRARSGLLLNPASPVDGEVFEVRLPSWTRGGWPPGRGLLVTRGQCGAVQVPMPDGAISK